MKRNRVCVSPTSIGTLFRMRISIFDLFLVHYSLHLRRHSFNDQKSLCLDVPDHGPLSETTP